MDTGRIVQIMSGEDRGVGAKLARVGLGVLTPPYRAAVKLRNGMFNVGLRRPAKLGRPTISIGNITTGGTGKTPMVIEVARRLIAGGAKPAVLMRGYMAQMVKHRLDPDYDGPPLPRHQLSDEQQELAAALEGVPVAADPDRVRSAKYVLHQHSDTSVFILDDGFQHRQVHRDLDLVLIDATRPFGFGRLLPRGLLREPVKNLKRAGAVILTRVEQMTADELADVDNRVAELIGRPPLAHAAMRWSGLRDGEEVQPVESLRKLRVLGLCGIGNPDAFERTLRKHAGTVAAMLAFPDHHAYTVDDWQRLLEVAHREDCQTLVATEKDWVKLAALVPGSRPLRVLRPVLSLEFVDGGGALEALLRKTVK